jgi:tRNA(fMet)-specific endonuclease VapC
VVAAVGGQRYLLDANTLSEPVRPEPNSGVLARLREHRGQLVTASVVWHELVFGAQRLPQSRRRAALERYLEESVYAILPILPYDTAAAEWHAAERARLSAIGRTPPYMDGQIAAIASTNDLVLVTANVADFRHFAELRVEDWRT